MADAKRYEITVVPKATYVADQSDPGKNQYVFAYTITITNTGDVAAQLVSRHWIITDAEHQVQEVKGLGVVGQQPLLEARRKLRVHERRVHPDGRGHDARHLPDARRGRRDVRRADPAVHAVRAAHAALSASLSRASCVGGAAACAARSSSTRRWPPR